MSELLPRMTSREFIGLVAVVGAFLTGLVGMAWCWFMSWQCHRRSQAILALKQDMIDRGFTPDDIRQVIEAGIGKSCDRLAQSM